MERKEYLNKCKECSMMCLDGAQSIKIDVPERLRVEYKGVYYYPVGYLLSFAKDGSVVHTAILHDLKANCVINAPLQRVN